jgi:hypothetical protein
MPSGFCSCQRKMCRAPGSRHCRAHPGCGAPAAACAPGPRPDERTVRQALAALKSRAGTHSPSVAELERAVPGLIEVDACFLSNPYATDVAMRRLLALPPAALERMVSHYPSQGGAIAELVSEYVGVAPERLAVGNGACELMRALLSAVGGPLLLSLPTFSAYYELASGPVVTHRLDARGGFRLDLDELEGLVARHAPETVVIINPNNPDGGLVDHDELVRFVARMEGRVDQVIVDESFAHFTTEGPPATLAGLVGDLPHLVVLTSLGKSHGIAGLRLGYAVASPERSVGSARRRCGTSTRSRSGSAACWRIPTTCASTRVRGAAMCASAAASSPSWGRSLARAPTRARPTSRCSSSTGRRPRWRPRCSHATASTCATAPTSAVSRATASCAWRRAVRSRTGA